jgi:hypothetical protein
MADEDVSELASLMPIENMALVPYWLPHTGSRYVVVIAEFAE